MMCLTVRGVTHSFRYSSTMPTRCLLAVTAWMWAALFLVAPVELSADPAYTMLFHLSPVWGWVLVFALDAVMLTWRIIDRCPRIGATRIINAATFGLWSFVLCASIWTRGYLAPDSAYATTMLFAALWTTLRTDLTENDRETA